MNKPSRRPQSITVALPASLTLDVPHLREKTSRLGFIARALATFRVEHVVIYNDQKGIETDQEARLIEKLLSFIETPQYLRRRLFKVDPDLQYAGTLPPLRTPNHPDRAAPSPGLIRDAVIVESGSTSMAEAGFQEPVHLRWKLPVFERVTIRLTRIGTTFEGEIVEPSELTIYWGFRVARGHYSIREIVRNRKFDMTISTSRKGTDVRQATSALKERWKVSQYPLIVFGSPSQGVPEILSQFELDISDVDFNLNTVPNQGVETVRTEEALWSSLAVINLMEDPSSGP